MARANSLGNGFTLLELLMASVLIGMVGLSSVALYGLAHAYLFQNISMVNTQGEVSYTMSHIRRYLLMANRVILYNANEVAFRYDHGSILATPATATSQNTDDDNWDYYGWDSATKTLRYRKSFVNTPNPGAVDPGDPGTSGSVVIARNIQGLTFTLVSPAQVDVDVTAQETIGSQSRTSHARTSINLRGMGVNQ